MKKKISKLQLKKTVITVLGNQEKRNQQAEAMAISFPVFSCRPGCNPTFKCPPPPDVAE